MNPAAGAIAVALVSVVTLALGSWGLRLSRTTSDFLVASRSVHPRLNASAISGEYISAASFLGMAGLLMVFGADMLWYTVGWSTGYLVLLVLVAAPLRRSGAYTLSDFAEARLSSRRVRAVCTFLVVLIGWLYLLPQFQGASVTLTTVIGAPDWLGAVVVGVVVLATVCSGGMRSITLVQAFQYWLKLTALLVPAVFLLFVWAGDGAPRPELLDPMWSQPVGAGGQGLYTTYSLLLATSLGTMGLPHVVVRFYTNPDGRATRRTTLVVLGLLGAFYVLPPVYAALGRVYAGSLVAGGRDEILVLELPQLMAPGAGGTLLSALITAGAFAAFLSTSSGLAIAVAGVFSQDLARRPVAGRPLGGVRAFRVGAVLAITVPCVVALVGSGVGVAQTVGLAFAVAASTFAPLLLLGIWWHGLTSTGASAGLLVGGIGSGAAAGWTIVSGPGTGWVATLLAQPAAWSVPAAIVVMVVVSTATRDSLPAHTRRFLLRLHTAERDVPSPLREGGAARPGG